MKISFLYGIPFGKWISLLRKARYSFPLAYLPKVLGITLTSLPNSLHKGIETLLYAKRIEQTEIQTPLFILGHWRGGTTHLQYMLAQDSRWATANTYQVLYPYSFLTMERIHSKLLNPFVPKKRPQDNMAGGLAYPNEDEIAMCVMSSLSPYLGWPFPQQELFFQRYFTFQEATEKEREQWKQNYLFFLKKLTYKYQKPLIVKSPGHTGRLKMLLELFPTAKFVHISRNPYDLFQSVKYLYQTWQSQFSFLSKPDFSFLEDEEALNDRIFRIYHLLYNSFFEEVSLIPAEQYCEVKYEVLEEEPEKEIKRVYQELELPDFDVFQPQLAEYLTSISEYQKIDHLPLSEKMRAKIGKVWHRNFEHWGYEP